MEPTLVLYPLIRRYAMTLGRLRRDPSSNQLRDDLVHLEAVIRMFNPAWDGNVKPIRPEAPIRWGRKGLATRAAMAVLGAAKEPMTVREITEHVMERLGISTEDEAVFHSVSCTVRDMLKRRTAFAPCVGDRRPKRWELSR
jgi:hypothetical protein